MARIPDSSKNIFSDLERCFSDRFTEKEVERLNQIATEAENIRIAAIDREDKQSQRRESDCADYKWAF
jgi:hypothetical protein